MTKGDKKRIMKCITHYRAQNKFQKAELIKEVIERCDFSRSTLFYKMTNMNWSRPEIDIFEAIIKEQK